MILHKLQRQRRPHHLIHKHLDRFPRTRLRPREQSRVREQRARGHEPPELRDMRAGVVAVARREERRRVRQRAQGEDVARHEDGHLGAVLLRQQRQRVEVDGRRGRRGARARVDCEEVDVAVLGVAEDRVDEVDRLAGGVGRASAITFPKTKSTPAPIRRQCIKSGPTEDPCARVS